MQLEKDKKANIEFAIKAEEMEERTVRFTISKEVVDRDGDIIRADGIDLTNFNKNPVFLLCHDSHDLPVGKVKKVWVEGKSVKADVYFPKLEELASDPALASEKAKLSDFVFHCYKTGMLNAVSIRFLPLEYEETKTGYDVIKWELLEFSAVPVPANQDSIAEAVKSFGLDESVVKDFFTTQKSGKRISAETKVVLNKLKACGDEIEKCRGQLKTIAKTMNELLASLDEVEEVITDEPKEEPKEEIELPDSGDEIELPDNEVELPD